MPVPCLTTALTGPLRELETRILNAQPQIEHWFRASGRNPPPFYGSVDLRNSGFKLAPVDMNLFPGGFKQPEPGFLPLAVQATQSALEKNLSRGAQRAARARKPHPQYLLSAQCRRAQTHSWNWPG